LPALRFLLIIESFLMNLPESRYKHKITACLLNLIYKHQEKNAIDNILILLKQQTL
jgi:hypothetical protein